MNLRTIFFSCFFMSFLALSSGCVATAVGIAAAGVAATKNSMEEIVESSYTQPYWCVYRATRAALIEMNITIDGITPTENGDVFSAKTEDYPVSVELKRVTDKLTKVVVEAGNNVFQQDQAVATAVVNTIQEIIDRNMTAYSTY